MEPLNLTEILTANDPEPEYLINNLIYTGQVILIAGEPGVGKSFLNYHIGMCLASGQFVLGREARQGRVLYFDEENSRPDLQQYVRWVWRGLGKPDPADLQERLYIEHCTLAGQGTNRFRYMGEVASRIKPDLIVVDTVTPCCGIEDENSNSEAAKAMLALRRIRELAGPTASMILLKHVKFSHDPNERTTIRGAKHWLGAVDAVIYHKLAVGKPRLDGLRNSKLAPDKVRAYGLRGELVIQPAWVGTEDAKGVSLHAILG
jgi:RecA-family ATPase